MLFICISLLAICHLNKDQDWLLHCWLSAPAPTWQVMVTILASASPVYLSLRSRTNIKGPTSLFFDNWNRVLDIQCFFFCLWLILRIESDYVTCGSSYHSPFAGCYNAFVFPLNHLNLLTEVLSLTPFPNSFILREKAFLNRFWISSQDRESDLRMEDYQEMILQFLTCLKRDLIKNLGYCVHLSTFIFPIVWIHDFWHKGIFGHYFCDSIGTLN